MQAGSAPKENTSSHDTNMPIFAVIGQGFNPNLGAKLNETLPDSVYDLGGGAWLVSAQGTAKEVSDTVGITTGEAGSAIVVEVASYFGRANPAIWSWVKVKWEGPPNG